MFTSYIYRQLHLHHHNHVNGKFAGRAVNKGFPLFTVFYLTQLIVYMFEKGKPIFTALRFRKQRKELIHEMDLSYRAFVVHSIL